MSEVPPKLEKKGVKGVIPREGFWPTLDLLVTGTIYRGSDAPIKGEPFHVKNVELVLDKDGLAYVINPVKPDPGYTVRENVFYFARRIHG